MTQITRRDFLKIALGTVPVAALHGPLDQLWLSSEKARPVADPRIVHREYGYLMDPDWDDAQWPTLRQARGYDDLDWEGKFELLIHDCVGDEGTLAEEYGIECPAGGGRLAPRPVGGPGGPVRREAGRAPRLG